MSALLPRLKTLLPAQFQELRHRYGLPPEYIAQNASQTEAAIALLRYAGQREPNAPDFPQLCALLDEISPPSLIRQKRRRWLGMAAMVVVCAALAGGWYVARDADLRQEMQTAQEFLRQGEYAPARDEYAKLLQKHPGHRQAQAGFDKAEALRAIVQDVPTGGFSASNSEVRVKDLQARYPNDADVAALAGRVYQLLGQTAAANQQYQSALALQPELPEAHFGLSLLALDRQDYAQAQQALQVAVKTAPLNVRYLDNLAYTFLMQGNYAEAQQQYQAALRIDPDFLLLYQEMALAYWFQGEIETAMGWLQRLDKHLGDERLTGLQKNQTPWMFTQADAPVTLYELADKRCYVLYSLSAGYYLLGKLEEAQELADQAQALKAPGEAGVRSLVKADLRRAAQAEPRWQVAAAAYARLLGE